MGPFDKLKSLFGPKNTNHPAQQAATLPVGGYEGASNYTLDRSFLWKAGHEEETAVAMARGEMLETVRYLLKNAPILEKIRLTVENYSVGQGISVTAASNNPDFNDVLSKRFDEWAKSPFCSYLNDLTFYEIQRLVASEVIIAGEVFVALLKGKKGWPQIQLVRSEMVRHSGRKSDKSKDGLILDGDGRVVAYQIFFNDKKPTIVQAQDVIHIKRTTQPGQLRGVSAFACAINSIRDYKDLVVLEKKALKSHSIFGAAVTKKNGDAGEGTFGTVARYNTKTAGSAAKVNPGLERVLGGQVAYLHEGEALQLLASARTTDGYQGFMAFLELLAREACLASGLPYDFVVNPNQTGPGMRFIISDAAAVFSAIQLLVTDKLIGRVFPWVAASLIKRGDITALPPADWFAHACTLPESITIDQGRRDAAELAFLEKGLTNYDSFYSARGQNWKDQLRQKMDEEAWIKDERKKRGLENEAN